jgi:hypothetical protein
MKKIKRSLFLFLTTSLIIGNIYTGAWAQQNSTKDECNMMDLIIARPLGVIAGIFGTGLFVVTLPFTIPTRSVDDAKEMLIIEPFRFSFVREFPDKNL